MGIRGSIAVPIIFISNKKQDTPWKMRMGWSIGVLLRLLSATGRKIGHRKMGFKKLIRVLLRMPSSTKSKINYRMTGTD